MINGSKIIQISTVVRFHITTLYALCEDGAIWTCELDKKTNWGVVPNMSYEWIKLDLPTTGK